jgi:hypothetical protein
MAGADDTVSIDIHGGTARIVGEHVCVIFDENGVPFRLAEEPSGGWLIEAIEPFEPRRSESGVPDVGARITLRRIHHPS